MGSRLWKLIGWLIGIGMVIFACYFLVFRVSPEERMRRTAEAATVTAGAVRTEVQSAMELVCQGTPYRDAAPFTGSGLHPVVVADEHSEFVNWNDQISPAWFPSNPAQTQLVVCVGTTQDISLEVCPYFGSDITRYRSDLPVRILEARTGNLVAQHTFIGTDPRHCHATENINTTTLYGDTASYSEVEGWVRQYIDAGAASTQPPAKEVNAYCGFQNKSPQYLLSDQQISIYWRWGTASEQYRQDYIDAVTFFLRLDGEGIDISGVERSLHPCEEGGLCVTWQLPPMTLAQGTHFIVLEEILHREVTDGFDLDANGNLDTYGPSDWIVDPPCEIIVP